MQLFELGFGKKPHSTYCYIEESWGTPEEFAACFIFPSKCCLKCAQLHQGGDGADSADRTRCCIDGAVFPSDPTEVP